MAIGTQEHSATIVSIAVDVTRQLEAKLTSLTVIQPHADQKEIERFEHAPKNIAQIARANGIEIETLIEQGNPIEKIRKNCEQFDLLIVGFSQKTSNSIIKPNISLHLLLSTPISTLFVPDSLSRN